MKYKYLIISFLIVHFNSMSCFSTDWSFFQSEKECAKNIKSSKIIFSSTFFNQPPIENWSHELDTLPPVPDSLYKKLKEKKFQKKFDRSLFLWMNMAAVITEPQDYWGMIGTAGLSECVGVSLWNSQTKRSALVHITVKTPLTSLHKILQSFEDNKQYNRIIFTTAYKSELLNKVYKYFTANNFIVNYLDCNPGCYRFYNDSVTRIETVFNSLIWDKENNIKIKSRVDKFDKLLENQGFCGRKSIAIDTLDGKLILLKSSHQEAILNNNVWESSYDLRKKEAETPNGVFIQYSEDQLSLNPKCDVLLCTFPE